MSRIVVVTGAGSGIGKSTVDVLGEQGHTVIGVDLKGADLDVDLSDPDAIARMVQEISETHDHVDAIVANAGTQSNSSLDLKVNYFGAIDTIKALEPLLTQSEDPRVAITASAASLQPTDYSLVELLLAGDREKAVAYGNKLAESGPQVGYSNYSASKRAIATWVRKVAPTEEFAGRGIAINAVAPGVVETPMTKELLASEEGRNLALGTMPAPLNGPVKPEGIAHVLAFVVSAENRSMTGQVLYVDGGFDSTDKGRGADIWHEPRHIDNVG
ncbi:SDR family oxidoreductase [Brevibacterium paucivorans]|uniref:SDR family oxidoreductase n=1 Tax=Brevibacterium paucivorans TaxID=170994 RepID=UPI00321B53D5